MSAISGTGVGPVSIASGRFLDASGTQLATFAATSASGRVALGSTGSFTFDKTAGSLSPANQCAMLPCGSLVTVELTLTGPDVAPNTTVVSAPMAVSCVF